MKRLLLFVIMSLMALFNLQQLLAQEVASRTISVSENDPSLGNAFIGLIEINEVTNQTGAVTVRAQSYSNCRFVNWTLNGEVVSTETSYVDTTEGDKHYVANFEELPKYRISIISNNPAMGSVIEINRDLYEGEKITLLAFPNEGYEFVNWTVDGKVVSINPEYSITIQSEVEYVANFQVPLKKLELVSCQIKLPASSSNSGRVVDGTKIIDGLYHTNVYINQGLTSGSTVTVELAKESVIENIRLYFASEGLPSEAKIQVSTDNKHWYDLKGTYIKKGEAKYHQHSSRYLITKNTLVPVVAKYVRILTTSASVYFGYSLDMWEFEVYEYPVDIAPRTITTAVNDATMGTAYVGTEGTTEVTSQTEPLVLVATPTDPSYKFVNWTVNGEVVSTDAHYYDVTDGDKQYVANFTNAQIFDVKVSSANPKQGSVAATQTGRVYEGQEVLFTAKPGGGCKFVNWTLNGEVVSTSTSYEIAITEDVDLVANFTDKYSQLTTVPTIYINTENGVAVTSKEDYVNAYVTVRGAENEEDNITEVLTEIKGRGNSTWGMAKKPYRLKFDEKIKFLGNEAKEKNWVLLANYADKTLLRNALALETARNMMNFGFTPSVTFVDVVLNGENLGSYMLTDQVEVKPKRVPVTEQETTTTMSDAEITGGYLIEVDGFADSEISWFQTTQGMKVTIKYPKDDEINADQSAYIANYTQNMENAMFSTNFEDVELGWRKYIDEASMVDWYIACELFGNSDAWWSTYMYKERDDVFKFGPLWDFDIAFNNDDRLGDATTLMMRTNAHEPKTWISRWWQDAGFVSAVKIRWEELRQAGVKEFMINYINNTEEYLQTSQQNNFNVWKILNTKVYRELEARGSYEAEVDFLRNYVTSRIAYLDEQFELSELTFSVVATPSDPEKGTAQVSVSQVVEGDSVILTATPKADYRFASWTLNGKLLSVENPYTTLVTSNSNYIANFVKSDEMIYGASLQGKAFGIPASQLGFNDQTPFSITFWIYFNEFNHEDGGTQLLNIRTPEDGWPASDWGYLWSTIAKEGSITDYGDRLKEGNLSLSCRTNSSSGEVLTPPSYVTFEPQKWYHVAVVLGYKANRIIELYVNGKLMASEDMYYYGMYSWRSSNVIMVGGPAFARAAIDGTIDDVRLYKKAITADEVKVAMQHQNDVTDEALIGYWDFEINKIETNKLYSVGSNKNLIACMYDVQMITEGTNVYTSKPFVFTAGYLGEEYDLYVTATPSDKEKGATEISANKVNSGEEVTLTATPAEGYEFLNWTVGGAEVSHENPYSVTITEHTDYVANFSEASGVISTEVAQTIKVAVIDGEIKLFGTTAGEEITLFTTSGVVVASAIAEDSVTTIPTNATGVIVVKVGERVLKVVK
ncbi:MAG: CotH kinase family protein [Bacteroidales bacterium]|nr:CotH kinase family protein [Bacteroidales bacterium]